jgi:hypothetical protein
MQRLRDDIAHRKARQAENPEQPPRAKGPGSRTDQVVRQVKSDGKTRASDTPYGGRGSPPPEFREAYREFTGGQEKK